jgi:hypothetical protein
VDLLAARFRQRAGLAHDLARRAQRKLEIDRLVDVAADHHRPIDALERHVAKAGGRELRAHDVRIRHRERARAARLRILPGWRQERRHDRLRHSEPGVVVDRAPRDEHQPPAGTERLAHVAHRGHGVGKEHHAEARESEVEVRLERIRLHVRGDEADVR